MKPPLVELIDVTVHRGERVCLRDVSWTIREGELWGIVGPNGAGKSTLISILKGDLPTSAGEVRFSFASRRGRERSRASGQPDLVCCVSFAGQHAILGKPSGYYQSRWHAGEDEEALRARDILQSKGSSAIPAARKLGLSGLLDRRATELSNGERRKLLLAAALAEKPALLVLDNPLTGLDVSSRKSLLATIVRLKGNGVQIVVTAARADEIPASVTHILLIHQGRIVASGERGKVQATPEYQRALLSAAMPAKKCRSSRSRTPRSLRSQAPSVVELKHATVRYAGKPCLRDVTWTVRRGERWAILGPNGAGKTTLLSLVLADNPQAYANDVSIFGVPRGSGESIWEIKRRIGFVSPELHLFHCLQAPAIDVVASGLHDSIGLYRSLSPGQLALAQRWMRRVGLRRAGITPFKALSEGEQRLLLLARALVKSPELLILDEPCQGLDDNARLRFLSLLDSFLRRNLRLTLLHVTHEPDEISSEITHGLLLRRGRVMEQGKIAGVLRGWRRI